MLREVPMLPSSGTVHRKTQPPSVPTTRPPGTCGSMDKQVTAHQGRRPEEREPVVLMAARKQREHEQRTDPGDTNDTRQKAAHSRWPRGSPLHLVGCLCQTPAMELCEAGGTNLRGAMIQVLCSAGNTAARRWSGVGPHRRAPTANHPLTARPKL